MRPEPSGRVPFVVGLLAAVTVGVEVAVSSDASVAATAAEGLALAVIAGVLLAWVTFVAVMVARDLAASTKSRFRRD